MLLTVFRKAAATVTRRVHAIAEFSKRFLDELRHYGLLRTFRHQFSLIAKRRSNVPPTSKSGSGGGIRRPNRNEEPQGLALIKHLQTLKEEASEPEGQRRHRNIAPKPDR